MFKIINKNTFFLKGTGNRFFHLATITFSVREFMVFMDTYKNKVYIEEVTGGSLNFIEDESLAKDLENFAKENKILEIKTPGQFIMKG